MHENSSPNQLTPKTIRNLALLVILVFFISASHGQSIDQSFEPSKNHPFGQFNPEAPESVKAFEPMIGLCDCKSVRRSPEGTWQDTTAMTWQFKYIMNGTAVQDEVWRPGNQYAGSIRQYQADSAQWVVTYFSYPAVSMQPGVWHGGPKGDQIILKMDQKAPNGMEGDSKLTFYNIQAEGFSWKAEWVTKDESFSYAVWMIDCKKRSQ
ncbi:MAG: hypothetical protein AAF598_04605 [Bacteroidota bacterium]